jgi:hypothetical protein
MRYYEEDGAAAASFNHHSSKSRASSSASVSNVYADADAGDEARRRFRLTSLPVSVRLTVSGLLLSSIIIGSGWTSSEGL